jgi:hypothetical protein
LSIFDKENINMLDLGIYTDIENNKMENKIIEYKKKAGKLLGKSRQEAKISECYYCGRPCNSFCNSHSIPAFCLRNIAVNGDVFYSNTLINLPLLDYEKGVNESGTFRIICRECDSKIFRDYENPNNYESKPTSKILAQIAMKNYLRCISKRLFELSLYNNMNAELDLPIYFYEQQQCVNTLDLQEFINGFKRAKKIDEKGWDGEYYLFYYERLGYVVPAAFQSNLTILSDFEGNTINDIYNMSPDYNTQDIHICIFPLIDSSIIMMFVDNKHRRYRNFYKQFSRLSHVDKLAAINYIIFCYSEDVFIYKGINQTVITDEKLKETSRKTSVAITENPMLNPIKVAKENFDLSRMGEIPNLLSEKYKVR